MPQIAVEILVGFTGFLSDFRAVFIYVAVAALAARVRWSGATTVAALAWLAVLLALALYWTSVKVEYREYVTGAAETQQIRVPLGERMAYLGDKALNIGNTTWGETSYLLLTRFAYIDIFGQVIAVDRGNREPIATRQWKEAFAHVFQPRFLFPAKAALSDSDVFMRLARSDPMEQIRLGTSISVGYMAENYVDLGFPGMLAGIFGYGAAVRTDCPIFHDADASLDAQGRHHHGACLQRRRYRDGSVAAETPGRDGDVFPGLVPHGQICLAGCHALARPARRPA